MSPHKLPPVTSEENKNETQKNSITQILNQTKKNEEDSKSNKDSPFTFIGF
jgi:hypothetical protein